MVWQQQVVAQTVTCCASYLHIGLSVCCVLRCRRCLSYFSQEAPRQQAFRTSGLHSLETDPSYHLWPLLVFLFSLSNDNLMFNTDCQRSVKTCNGDVLCQTLIPTILQEDINDVTLGILLAVFCITMDVFSQTNTYRRFCIGVKNSDMYHLCVFSLQHRALLNNVRIQHATKSL